MGFVEGFPCLSFRVLAEGFVSLQVSNILEKHLLVAVQTLKKLCLTVPPELTDSLLTLISYFAKLDTICVLCFAESWFHESS